MAARESRHFRHLANDDPNFSLRALAWAHQSVGEMKEVVSDSKRTIATSKRLMADVDRLLARRSPRQAWDD
jgi:hypothetical protein